MFMIFVYTDNFLSDMRCRSLLISLSIKIYTLVAIIIMTKYALLTKINVEVNHD